MFRPLSRQHTVGRRSARRAARPLRTNAERAGRFRAGPGWQHCRRRGPAGVPAPCWGAGIAARPSPALAPDTQLPTALLSKRPSLMLPPATRPQPSKAARKGHLRAAYIKPTHWPRPCPQECTRLGASLLMDREGQTAPSLWYQGSVSLS